ncbi:HNH endonuclease [Spartinivicinus poritis]|uniref:HNH endonuclease n=1 Tax=Spartinivicinus poritis TaxID=2994640 RepID=A0ABT5U9F9_9GAMM|nr:HNH endonuclease [Spartinivicinus sp. A2-2]MDE1462103.1 HNH endonuclease [Spartinivicinus sp. A2-2]
MRDYKKEYKEYHSKPEQKKRRAMRNAARRLMIKKGLAKKGDGKDVDHKDRNPLNNSIKNLRTTNQKKNRGWRKHDK